jgi:hypothetical protein
MTVKELIVELQTVDQNALVFIRSEHYHSPLAKVHDDDYYTLVDPVSIYVSEPMGYITKDPMNSNSQKAVFLYPTN